MRSVQAVLDLAEKADRDPPMDFFDAWVDSFTIEPQSGGGSHINMKVVVPSSSRYHRQPGSTSRSVLSVMSGVANKMNQLRLSVVSDEKAKTDFGRMEKDGSLRDFAPGEGTW